MKRSFFALLLAVICMCVFIGCTDSGDDGIRVIPSEELSDSEDISKITETTAEHEMIETAETTVNTQPVETAETTAKHETTEAVEPEKESLQDENEGQKRTYMLNLSTKKFHYTSCKRGPSEKNREDRYTTREELIAQGFSPCGICKP